MSNKYQEALDNIFRYYVLHDDEEWCDKYETSQEDFDTLQELIYLVSSLKRERDEEYALRCEYEEEIEELKSGW